MGLSDLQKIKEQLEKEQLEQQQEENNNTTTEEIKIEEKEETKKDYSSFDNYTKKRITVIGYTIGLKDDILNNPPFESDYLEKLREDEELKIFRELNIIRSCVLHNYDKIYKLKEENGPFMSFEDMSELINQESLAYLTSKKLEIFQVGVGMKEFTKHIANINQLIEERVDILQKYMPEWIKWNYIKDLFIMQGCASGINGCNYKNKKKVSQINNEIHKIRKDYYEHVNFYPYKTFMVWNPKRRNMEVGNILFNDCKFLTVLYEAHGDVFRGAQYVIDAKEEVKENIYDFINESENLAIFVDCENVDPYCFASVFKNLDESRLDKIKKIVLYDDVNTSNAWEILRDIIDIEVEHVEVERIKDNKSLVDHALSIGVTKAVYENKIESIIIASSDSDFWSLIKYLDNVRFFVMNETEITSSAVLEKLDDYKIPHCFIDKFAQDKIQPYKNMVLKKNFMKLINQFNDFGYMNSINVDEIIETVFRESGINVPYRQLEQEKQDFYNKYIKKLRLVIADDENGKSLKIVLD